MQNNLAYFFPIGGGLTDLQKSGQDKRFVNGEYPYYLESFKKIYLFDYSDKFYDTASRDMVQIVNKYQLSRFAYTFLLPFINRRLLNQCSLIRVSHLLGMPPAIIAKLIFRLPIVFNYGYDYESFARLEKKYLRAFIFKILKGISLKFADGVICTNRKIFQELKTKCKAIEFIPNRVDTELFKPVVEKRGDDYFHILFVGRLEKQKNILNLIRAIEFQDAQKIKVTLIGRGSQEEEIRNEIQKNHLNFQIINHVGNDVLPAWYNWADLFILPSYKEGSPKVLLEAMSCGSVCLVSDIPENLDILKNEVNGFVCGTDVQSIGDSIKNIMNRKNLQKISLQARETIEENYSFKLLMKKEVDFLIKIASL